MPRPEQCVAFLHELVHVAVDENKIEIEIDKEERICDAVSQCLAEIIARNPKVLSWLEKSLSK